MKLIFNIIQDFGALEHFLSYYASRGITEFLCGLHNGMRSPHYDDIATKLNPFRHRVVLSYSEEFNGERDAEAQNIIRKQFVAGHEWYMIADPDEFHYHPAFKNFLQMAEFAQSEGANYVGSCIIDRLSLTGEPAEIVRDRPLDEQFPLASRFTEDVLGGCGTKVVMALSSIKIEPGHHFACGKMASLECRTHHFKWQGRHFGRLMEDRFASYRRQELYYAHESLKLLSHLADHDGRINTGSGSFRLRFAEEIGA